MNVRWNRKKCESLLHFNNCLARRFVVGNNNIQNWLSPNAFLNSKHEFEIKSRTCDDG